MLRIYRTIDEDGKPRITTADRFGPGIWVSMVAPTPDEIAQVTKILSIPPDYIRAALDEEERPRIETEDGFTLVVIDIPIPDPKETILYTTIPLGIVVTGDAIVTVCLAENTIVNDFATGRVRGFYTFKKTRFVLQILFRNASYFLQYLRQIERISDRLGAELHRSLRNRELLQLLNLKKSLVYFSTSLRSNALVLDKILKFQPLRMYPDDTDLLEDVIIENRQAIEMANTYSTILTETMDAFASIISNNFNGILKFLTAVTIILAVPTMIASFLGMNVPVPLENDPGGFLEIVLVSLVISGILAAIMLRKDWL
ncbi:magnesium transporter CorA family protein [Methanoculleus sp. FWC-SCC1]|uniref:Magnesium transporter CorA family protein n=1 Tax=Methanoculleus frigidifontis TaxID=2584085 RepID=A0ABT8MA59_9EURY|nr:magnesium transporter CorA family protein [Methanoculleus sp. FWC-SCC1]MDN7024823.1 magnesium transporter CorA family protein [Methanoculleus sp. FWC-SCC1]